MRLDKNNNSRIIYRIAKSNLLARKASSFISLLSILLVTALTSALSLFILGQQTAERRILDQMQHVMYMDVTDRQLQNIASDEKVELCLPYKSPGRDFQAGNVKYSFSYVESNAEKISTYVIVDGILPKKYNEIAVDKAFMEALGRECSLGDSISLDAGGTSEEFVITGYTDAGYATLTHPVRVSREFAENSPLMKKMPYTALVRLKEDVIGGSASAFTTAAYQIAMDYGIVRQNVNLNGRFELSLQKGNVGLYTIFFVSLLFFIAGSIVIYSIFYFSVTARVQQVGQFLTIGMTEKQVKKMIRREGLLLSAAAVPMGLLPGGMIAYIALPDGWSFVNYGVVSLLSALLGFLAVQLSIGRPASIAAKVSPIDAYKNNVDTDKEEKTKDRRHQFLTPFKLAQMESRNNRKRLGLTTMSLAFGGILFMVAATWIASWDEDAFSREGVFADSEYRISYSYDVHGNPQTYGITDSQRKGNLSHELEDEIRKIPHVKNVHIERTATGVISYQGAAFTQPFCPLSRDDTEYFQLPAEGNNSYEYMVEHDAILIVDRTFPEKLNGITFIPGEKLQISYFDGEEHPIELEIAAVSEEKAESYPERTTFCMSDVTMKKLWGEMNTAESFSISVDHYEENGVWVEEQIRALLSGYDDLSLSTLRERKLEDAAQIPKLEMQIYGIAVFVIMFGIFNLINTVCGSIVSRKKQLSMLESIGMEKRQIRNMLLAESLFLALPNILITVTLGTAAGYGFISLMQISYLKYHFPAAAILLYVAGMTGIPMFIAFCCLKMQDQISLVERIRNED